MRKTLGAMAAATIAAAASLAGSVTTFGGGRGGRRPAPEFFTKNGIRYKRTWNRKYPEQSSRQAMRRFRRANGGPGIYLHAQRNVYLPIGCPSLEAFEDNNWQGARA